MPTADRAAAPYGAPAGENTGPDTGAPADAAAGTPYPAPGEPGAAGTGCPVCGAAVPEDAGPEDAGPEDAGPEDAGPEGAGPEGAGPEGAGPEGAGPEDAGPEDAGPGAAGLEDAGPEDAGLEDAGPEDAGPEDAGPAECPGCRWPLRAGPVLGPLTPELLRAFDDRLATARRRYDLTAAARAAGHPGHGDDASYARLQRHVRNGPPRPGEAAEALRGPWPEEPPARPLREVAEAHARGAAETLALEIAADGLTAVVFARADDGDLYERAETDSWPWTSLLRTLPADPVAARFLLAGGTGDRPPGTARDLEWALPDPPRPGTAPPVLVCGLPGWPVPERVLAALRRRHPDALAVRIPTDLSRPPRQVLRHAPGLSALACGPGPEPATAHLAVGRPDGSAEIRAPGAAEPLAERDLHTGRVTALDLAPGLGALVTGGSDGAVRLWSYGGSGRSRALAWHEGWVNAVRYRAGAVFSLGDDGLLRRSDPARLLGAPDGTVYPLKVGWSAATALEVTSDGRTLAVGGAAGVGLWDARSGHRLGRLTTGSSVTGLALDAGDRLLAVGCADGRVHVHDLRRRTGPEELPGHTGAVRHLTFGPHGLLAACGESGAIRAWPAGRARQGSRGTPVGLHTAAVRGLAVTPDGHLLSASADGLVRAWPAP